MNMSLKVLFAVAALFLATGTAHAQVTGDVLLKWCSNTKTAAQCDAYLLGVTDTIIAFEMALSPPGICIPDTDVKQQRAVVVPFLKERPHHLKFLVVDVIFKAYEEKWPCPK
jgi:Rap1a immunity proteins